VPPPDPLPPPAVEEEIAPLLMEGIRQLDEWREQSSRLPRLEVKVELVIPLEPKLRELTPDELDVVQAVLPGGTIQSILDCAPQPDVDLAKAIGRLLERGYVRVA